MSLLMKQLKPPKWTVAVVLLSIGVYGVIALYLLRIFMITVIMETTLPKDIPSELQSNSEAFDTVTFVFGLLCFLAVSYLTLRNLYRIALRHDSSLKEG